MHSGANRTMTTSKRNTLLVQLLCVVALFSCGTKKQEFLGTRVKDSCNGEWPVCSEIVGCLLGDTSYVEGKFPGEARVIVQLFEPSTVTASLYLEETSAAGAQTVFNFNEDACRARQREAVNGKALLDEFEKTGVVFRKADLSGVGDHLVTVTSDARSKFMLKIDVAPTRLNGATN